jgi:Adenosine deaminase z-alpha domain
MVVKKTNVADTSILAYHSILREGLIKQEKYLVIKLMENIHSPVTSRQLMNITNKERGNITRVLYDLEKQKKITISHKDKCPITGRTVRFYKLAIAAEITPNL